MIGAKSRVLRVFLPGNSYRINAMAAKIPMIATTISSSIRVKPLGLEPEFRSQEPE